MSKPILILIFINLHFALFGQVNSLPSEYYDVDVCLASTSQWALDVTKAEEELNQIYSKLNFSSYKIEIIKCNKIRTSALALLYRGERYILINENELTDLNTHYYSHLFVIAHEFSHHYLNHFGSNVIPSNANKRSMELAADQYAASLVKKLGGDIADCYYALNQMRHPSNPLNSDHPSKEDREAAVERGFGRVINPVIVANYTDYAASAKDVSLLKYSGEVNSTDITDYYVKYGMFPVSIFKFNGSYWIYWQTMSSVVDSYSVFWNQSEYPEAKINSYLNKKYNIEFIEKINGKWFVVMLKYKKDFDQTVLFVKKSDLRNYKGDYEEWQNSGYCIQNVISYNVDYYFLLLTPVRGLTKSSYGFFDNFSSLQTWINENEGLNYLYCYKVVDNQYFGFLLTSPDIEDWTVNFFDGTKSEFKKILDKINDGYSVENIVVDSQITFILTK